MNDLISSTVISMTSQQIADLVEKRHDNVKRTVDNLANQGVIEFPQFEEIKTATKPVEIYRFSGYRGKRDSIIVVAQLSPKFTARLVDRWQELEYQTSKLAIPDFSNPAAAARAWAEQYEAAQLAVKTKAEIGSRREATAMNTASQAVKRINKLEIELDKSKQYATIKRMEMIYQGVSFNWRLLRSISTQMELPAIDVFDQNYGTVKAYHEDVWLEAYALSIEVA